MNTRIIYSLFFYFLIVILIIVSKPSVLFEPDGNIKPFGVGEEKTIFSLGVLIVVLALLCFYIVTLIDIIFK
jgi:hypothetical protein